MTQNTNEILHEILHVIGTDLLDYSFKVEKAIKEGYTFSNSNEYAPRAWPHMFEAWMLLSPKDEEGKIMQEKTEVETPVKPSQSSSVASNGTTEGVDSGNETKAATVVSKGVTKRGRK